MAVNPKNGSRMLSANVLPFRRLNGELIDTPEIRSQRQVPGLSAESRLLFTDKSTVVILASGRSTRQQSTLSCNGLAAEVPCARASKEATIRYGPIPAPARGDCRQPG